MNYLIDKNSPMAAYKQLYEQIKNEITGGIYSFGEKLPSKRLIAEETGISTITVEHTYQLLCEEGYTEARQRSGYFVIFRNSDGIINTEPIVETTLHAGADYSETAFPFSVLASTMRKVINDYGSVIYSKTDNSGCLQLRQAISRYLIAARGINAKPEQIIIGSGSEYLYGLIIQMFGRSCVYAIEKPSYKKIEQVYSGWGANYEMLPLAKDGIDSASLASSKAEILHISPFRSYPSGVTATASKRHEYLRWAEKGRFIIEDDFESEFSLSAKPAETLFGTTKKDNVIYMNSFSKTLGPGVRAAYMVLPEKLIPLFSQKAGFYSCTVPAFDQYVLATLLTEGHFQRHINRTRRNMRKKSIQ